jgi:sulfoxide reductase heme-binding subunit YedZ
MSIAAPIEEKSGLARRGPPLAWLPQAIVAGSLVPFAVIGVRMATGRLGANPIATALNQLGLLTLIFLMACLSCTPIVAVFRIKWPLRVRKTLGLLAFFTALAHFLLYAVVDQGLAVGRILADVGKRPFIALGAGALLLLVPLALTSTKRAVQDLGFARWKLLHRLIYVVGILAVAHFYVRVKADTTEPAIYGALLFVLFVVRIADAIRSRKKRRR